MLAATVGWLIALGSGAYLGSALLAAAPGGIAEMSITAKVLRIGVAYVTAAHVIRYMIVGTYVGFATVAGYAWWFMYYQGGPQITFHQLTHFHQCSNGFLGLGRTLDCSMFVDDRAKAATSVSLSILVIMCSWMRAFSCSRKRSSR